MIKFIVMIIILMIFLFSLLTIGMISVTNYDNAQKKACNDLDSKRIIGNGIHYCVNSEGFAQEIIFDCTGLVFNFKCKVIPIIK